MEVSKATGRRIGGTEVEINLYQVNEFIFIDCHIIVVTAFISDLYVYD